MGVAARFKPAGDQSVLVELGEGIHDSVSARVRGLAYLIEHQGKKGFGEVILGYKALLVHYDPMVFTYREVVAELEKMVEEISTAALPPSRLVEIPTLYGDKWGPDLEDVAEYNGLTPEEVISIHSNTDYLVYFLGFTPGFPFLGGMSEKIATPRLPSPRLSIPAGSVGIANNQTGLYPTASPGGWRLIGRTPLRFYDPSSEQPFLLQAGDHVRFIPIDEEEYLAIEAEVKEKRYVPVIRSYS